jgi:hypothetical protein
MEEELVLFFSRVKAHTISEIPRNNPTGAATK